MMVDWLKTQRDNYTLQLTFNFPTKLGISIGEDSVSEKLFFQFSYSSDFIFAYLLLE